MSIVIGRVFNFFPKWIRGKVDPTRKGELS